MPGPPTKNGKDRKVSSAMIHQPIIGEPSHPIRHQLAACSDQQE